MREGGIFERQFPSMEGRGNSGLIFGAGLAERDLSELGLFELERVHHTSESFWRATR